jgi:cytochrome bd-type quinol oxidase subunit 2
MKFWVILAFVAIIGSLGSALLFMMKNTGNANTRSRKMALALALRVALSILLFAGILLAWKLGYIHPSGIPVQG